MLPVERIIGEEGLSATPRGARLAMRLPWYRSLPFSTVEVAGVTLDGAPVDLADAIVEFDDTSFPLSDIGEQTNAFWFVRDSAFLVLPGVNLAANSEHEVSLLLHVNPPYIPGMKRVNPQTATLRVN
ncbi:C-glycoside deglycosidase beta subunit domain-containing protein [Novosphingobium sediminicola]|uniref:C-deglycosylation enzyme beta subunit n=1 Tax=Novosphingobium sediminicola TaxID=563162 RepID=A0A7W6CJ76_9SPHN|nr:DUF6379 domain-containing protein [Novosphingobium sediminicola]MBB3954051.1 hypothetical protein [Novosphingobium sediminicola]